MNDLLLKISTASGPVQTTIHWPGPGLTQYTGPTSSRARRIRSGRPRKAAGRCPARGNAPGNTGSPSRARTAREKGFQTMVLHLDGPWHGCVKRAPVTGFVLGMLGPWFP